MIVTYHNLHNQVDGAYDAIWTFATLKPLNIQVVFLLAITNSNSWNECVVEALNYSTNFLAQQKNEDVNEFKLATKFLCKEIENV